MIVLVQYILCMERIISPCKCPCKLCINLTQNLSLRMWRHQPDTSKANSNAYSGADPEEVTSPLKPPLWHHFSFWGPKAAMQCIFMLISIVRWQEMPFKCLNFTITLDPPPPSWRLRTFEARRCELCPHGVRPSFLKSWIRLCIRVLNTVIGLNFKCLYEKRQHFTNFQCPCFLGNVEYG